VDPSKQFRLLRKAFKHAAYTIKDGEIVVKNGEVVKAVGGKTYWVKPELVNPIFEASPRLKKAFEDYYTVQYENYIVPEHHLAASRSITVKAEV
jgi:formylmethanofuran dehydrogenase subunit A